MPILELSDVYNSYGDTLVIDGVSLSADRGELVCLLGPSGCGKTTLLRLISGLEKLDSGTISFDGTDLDGVPPSARGFGLMFQDLALFPHMDVRGNVGFGLRMQRLSNDAISDRVDEMLNLVGLSSYGKRKIHELSGGERQRVALARSLAPAPKLLMLDEPLASLDRVLRESLQIQVRSILKEVGVTAIYVTHDKDEAFAIADTIVFMDRGSVAQTGPPETLFRSPANELIAHSLGLKNIIKGKIDRASDSIPDSVEIACPVGTLLTGGPLPAGMGIGDDVLVVVDERGFSIKSGHRPPSESGTSLDGVVEARKFRGGEIEVHIAIGEGKLVSVVLADDARSELREGDEVSLGIPSEAITLLPVVSGKPYRTV
ncbi:MAG: ABC transporter ATP-binding protein [Chloroflexi bacterium]|jgi:ABC-type Fe3+/spermidine/putrescine transport system ATPase subunit|nr:ABC transporter ATP-binding protein [Chloroflexota bacterium]MBT5319147.1 ABC transporter ATP-binding protein [Chloroflexota bacterium]